MINPLNNLGTIQKFSGVNINQTRNFNHLHCETYLNKIIAHLRLENLTARSVPTPMKTDTQYQADIQLLEEPESLKNRKNSNGK